jgi:predicted Zn-dependent peptidase
MKTELISQEEFEKVRNQFENNFVSSNASIAGVAENLADNHVYYGSASRVNTQLDGYMKVTREDIQRVAKKYLTQDARVILHYLPKETK